MRYQAAVMSFLSILKVLSRILKIQEWPHFQSKAKIYNYQGEWLRAGPITFNTFVIKFQNVTDPAQVTIGTDI